MPTRIDQIRQRVLADHAASWAVFTRLTPEQWAAAVPSDEGAQWTAKDVLAHVAISEGGQLTVLTRYLAGEAEVIPADFDLARYNRGSVKKRADKTVAELLQEIEAGHARLLETLAGTPEDKLDLRGRHARGDQLTIEGFFLRVTEHRRLHAEELRQFFGLAA